MTKVFSYGPSRPREPLEGKNKIFMGKRLMMNGKPLKEKAPSLFVETKLEFFHDEETGSLMERHFINCGRGWQETCTRPLRLHR
jgi:hypothetical protein